MKEKRKSQTWSPLLIFFTVNLLGISLFSFLAPSFLVLGSWQISPFAALILNSLLLTFFLRLSFFLEKFFPKRKKGGVRLAGYFGSNTLGLWLLSRGSSLTGLGISSFLVAIFLGGLLAFLESFFLRKWTRLG